MRIRLSLAAALLAASIVFTFNSVALSAGCNATKTDSTGRTCILLSESVTSCIYYNDAAHCTVGPLLQ